MNDWRQIAAPKPTRLCSLASWPFGARLKPTRLPMVQCSTWLANKWLPVGGDVTVQYSVDGDERQTASSSNNQPTDRVDCTRTAGSLAMPDQIDGIAIKLRSEVMSSSSIESERVIHLK